MWERDREREARLRGLCKGERVQCEYYEKRERANELKVREN